MNKGIIYCTKIREEYEGAHMEHMIAEKLLEIAQKKEYGINLYNEPRAMKGPFPDNKNYKCQRNHCCFSLHKFLDKFFELALCLREFFGSSKVNI